MTPPKRKRLGEILVDAGVIEEYQVNTALTEQKRWGGKLGEHLIRLGYITEDTMLDALRNQLNIPSVNLKKREIPQEIIQMIPADILKKHTALPVGIKKINDKDHLIIAMSDPSNLDSLDEIQFSTQLKVMPALAGPMTLEKALKYYLDHLGDLFEEKPEGDPFSPKGVRKRMDISEGSKTFQGESLEGGTGMPRPAPRPTPVSLSPEGNLELETEGLQQIRAELSALRDLLVEKGVIDRKTFVERVVKNKTPK